MPPVLFTFFFWYRSVCAARRSPFLFQNNSTSETEKMRCARSLTFDGISIRPISAGALSAVWNFPHVTIAANDKRLRLKPLPARGEKKNKAKIIEAFRAMPSIFLHPASTNNAFPSPRLILWSWRKDKIELPRIPIWAVLERLHDKWQKRTCKRIETHTFLAVIRYDRSRWWPLKWAQTVDSDVLFVKQREMLSLVDAETITAWF